VKFSLKISLNFSSKFHEIFPPKFTTLTWKVYSSVCDFPDVYILVASEVPVAFRVDDTQLHQYCWSVDVQSARKPLFRCRRKRR